MKKILTTFVVVFCVAVVAMIISKKQQIQPEIVDIQLIEVDGSLKNGAMDSLIAPYKAEKEVSMNVVIGEVEETMEVGLPESKLSNLIADVLLTEGRKYIADVDIAVTNIGGIRRTLFAGPLTIGDVFEILPFDNSLLVLEYKGVEILALADAVALKGGEAIAGMTLTIRDGKAEDVKVGGEVVDTARVYRVVSTDYLSWGNDQLEPLANYVKSTPLNMMMRDAMFDYVTCATIKGEKIVTKLDNRIIVE